MEARREEDEKIMSEDKEIRWSVMISKLIRRWSRGDIEIRFKSGRTTHVRVRNPEEVNSRINELLDSFEGKLAEAPLYVKIGKRRFFYNAIWSVRYPRKRK